MFEVFTPGMVKKAVLHNAYDRRITHTLNGVGKLQFKLPSGDPKAEYCQPLHIIHDGNDQYYRILVDGVRTSQIGELEYTAEHCIATLVDSIMPGNHIVGNLGVYTNQVIEYILARQKVKHWQLGTCDFRRQFEYGFTDENLLNALFSVPNLFVDPYAWTFDMRSHPWTLHLKRIDQSANPQFYIRAGKNLISSRASRTSANLCTRLYLRGYGEGDNQLTIRSVNGGVEYLQSPRAYTDRYGIVEKVFVDRRFERADSLMERGKALLEAMQEPQYTREFDVVDLYPLTGQNIDRAEVGDIIQLNEDGTRAYVTGVSRNVDVAGDMKLDISTVPDLAASISDLADRQRIEQIYSQGATQIYAQSVQANADTTTPAQLNFFIPGEMRIVNSVKAKITIERFRSYNRATKGGGATKRTSGAGGSSRQTSGAGGSSTPTSGAGGATTPTSGAGGASTPTSGGGGGGIKTSQASGKSTPTSSAAGQAQITSGASSVRTVGSSAYETTNPLDTAITEFSNPTAEWLIRDYSGSTDGSGTGSTGTLYGSTGEKTAVIGSPHSHSMNHEHSVLSHTHRMSHGHAMQEHTHRFSHTHMFAHHHNIDHTHEVTTPSHSHTVTTPAHTHDISLVDHTHSVSIPAHTHTVSISSHTHTVSIPSHTHTVDLPNHTHDIDLPDHTHEVVQGIFRFGNPTAAQIYINGQKKADMGSDREIDLTSLLVGSDNTIPRGSWIRFGVLPNDLAYITIDIIIQGFVQSRGGGTY